MNIFSFVYLAVFLLAGFCIARRALPQAGLSVSIPLGCGFGVSLLAFVPACFAVVLGFRLPALLLAAAVVVDRVGTLARVVRAQLGIADERAVTHGRRLLSRC